MENTNLTMTLVLFAGIALTVSGQNTKKPKVTKVLGEKTSQGTAAFRYAIISSFSEVEETVNDNFDDHAFFYVLLEDNAFTESNLLRLYGLLDKRLTDKPYFDIVVTNSLNAIYTPEEFDNLPGWGLLKPTKDQKSAFFYRLPSGKRIVYTISGRVKDREIWVEK